MGLKVQPDVSTQCMLVPRNILSAEHRLIKELDIVIKKTCYSRKKNQTNKEGIRQI